MRNAGFVVLVGVWVLALGCGQSGPAEPKTHPVKGKVVVKGGPPLKGGFIEFRSAAGSNHTVNANVENDGTFKLHTLIGNKKLDGAPEGEYSVNVIPPMGPDQKAVAVRVLEPKHKVSPGVNDLTVTIEKVAAVP